MSNVNPYIRGTSRKYGTDENGGFWGENGYNCIEAGYLVMADNGRDIEEVIELIPSADVIGIGIGEIFEDLPTNVQMDCVGDGYPRLFTAGSKGHPLKWNAEKIPVSDMRIVIGEPTLPRLVEVSR